MSDGEQTFAYEFGDWVVEPHLNRIRRGAEETQLEPRTSDVLRHLLDHPGEIVSVDELLDTVWAGRVVEPNAIHRNINRIRRALGDNPRQPTYIETISKRGYRAIAPVRRMEVAQPADAELIAELERVTPPFPAYDGDEPYVFVCYSHEDREDVYRELLRLRDAGINVWYDEGISVGSEWTDEIANAIADCAHFLFFASPRAVQSHYCLDEVQLARKEDKPLVAVHLEPTALSRSLQLSIGRFQALLKYELSEQEYARKLLGSLGPYSYSEPGEARARPGVRRLLRVAAAAVLSLAVIGWLVSRLPVIERYLFDAPENSVAVNPFEDMTPTHEPWIAGTIVSNLRVSLRDQGLLVVGSTPYGADQPTSAVSSARYVLEGRVTKVGRQIQVVAELMSTENGYQIWAEDYDRTITLDDFSAQSEIARLIAVAVAEKIASGGAPTLIAVEPDAAETGALQGVLSGAEIPEFSSFEEGDSDE